MEVIIATLALVGGLAAAAVQASRRAAADRTSEAWKATAERLGGRFTGDKAGLRLVVRADDVTVAVTVETDVESAGETTVLRAAVPYAPRLRLEVLPAGPVLSGFGRALGGQDVVIGDAAFDRRAMVKADDEALARAWLGERARTALLAADGYRFAIDGGEVVAARHGVENGATALLRAIAATVTLARAGLVLGEAWAKVARELGVPDGAAAWAGWTRAGVAFAVGTVQVEVVAERGEWLTRVRAPLVGVGLDRFVVRRAGSAEPPGAASMTLVGELAGLELRVGEHEGDEARARERLAIPGQAALAALSPEWGGRWRDEASLVWRGVSPDAPRLRRAIALVQSWAGAGGDGPYR